MSRAGQNSNSTAGGTHTASRLIWAGVVGFLVATSGAAQTKLPNPTIVKIHNSGRPTANCFNIVIVAEGFRSSDMDVFRQSVATVAGRFLHLNLKIAIEFG